MKKNDACNRADYLINRFGEEKEHWSGGFEKTENVKGLHWRQLCFIPPPPPPPSRSTMSPVD